MPPYMEPEARFERNVRRDTATGCWIWTGRRDRYGYGLLSYTIVRAKYTAGIRGQYCVAMAHKWSWKRVHGPVPDGLQLDHLCRVHNCVNPAHLEAVTQRINLLRGNTISANNAAKTRCPRGHAFSPENTWWRVKPNGNRARRCRICTIRQNRASNARQRQDRDREGQEKSHSA